jgi:hypothetical protein
MMIEIHGIAIYVIESRQRTRTSFSFLLICGFGSALATPNSVKKNIRNPWVAARQVLTLMLSQSRLACAFQYRTAVVTDTPILHCLLSMQTH